MQKRLEVAIWVLLLARGSLNFTISFLNFLASMHQSQPFMNHGVVVQRKTSERMLSHPRLEMVVDRGDPAR